MKRQLNQFEAAALDMDMRWPTSWEREMHLDRMELRREGTELVNNLKTLGNVLKDFNAIWQ